MGQINVFSLYLENPFINPNEKHIAELHNKVFLNLLRETALKRLSDGIQSFYNERTQLTPLEYLKTKCNSIKLIGGFLTKFVRDNSDIDITVILKDPKEMAELQSFFRNQVNFKPLSEQYQYVINYFCNLKADHIIKFKRHGIELLNQDIFTKDVEDVFLDNNMVVVQDVLSKKKLTEYFVLPLEKAINIIKKDILSKMDIDIAICDKLIRTYSLLNRVGSETFPEFKKLPKQLTIYEYTQDNLRYKALNEESEIHMIMVLAQSYKLKELRNYLLENTESWMRKEFTIDSCLESNILTALRK